MWHLGHIPLGPSGSLLDIVPDTLSVSYSLSDSLEPPLDMLLTIADYCRPTAESNPGEAGEDRGAALHNLEYNKARCAAVEGDRRVVGSHRCHIHGFARLESMSAGMWTRLQ